ncbi:TolC family protein [Aridibaculum aurantiacum]|uniref:TolC family protein n=1 Tax=Aridibaculum aurantiacum TaxID=2810307 RepID=UPI001A956EA6|nr:TolC family protein [Aridibaculum aurantiacum]
MRRMMLPVLAALLSVVGMQANAQQTHELTIKQAVELAFKNLADIKNAEIDVRLQQARNKEITGQALPQVAGNAAASHYFKLPAILFPDASQAGIYSVLLKEGLLPNGTAVPAPVLQRVSFQQPWNLQAGVTLTQLLFQPDVFVGLQARKASIEYQGTLLEQQKEKIKDSAYRRYYAILITQKQLHFINESVTRLEKLHRDNTIMYQNGFVEKLDVDRVQVQLTNLKTTQSVLANAVELSHAALKFAIGVPQSDSVILKEELSIETVKANLLDNNFKYDDRVEIQMLEKTKELQELDLKRHKLGYIPTVAASGNYTVNGLGQKFFTNSSTSWINSAFVGLNVNVPIFDGFQRKQRVEQSRLNLQKLENTIGNVKQAIDLQQVVTQKSLTNALLNLDAQDRNMKLAESVYATTKKKFEQGLSSSFEVLQADTELQNAQSNYFTALYNAIVARIGYQSSLGKLE